MDARAERFRSMWSWIAACFVVVVFWAAPLAGHGVKPALFAIRIFAVLGPAAALISIRRGARRGLPLLGFLALWTIWSLLSPGHAPWTTVIQGPLMVTTLWVLGRHGWLRTLPWLLVAAAAGAIVAAWPHPAPGILVAALPFAGLAALTEKGSRAMAAGFALGLGLVAAYATKNPLALLGAAAVLALLSGTLRTKHRPAVYWGVWALIFAATAATAVMGLNGPSNDLTLLSFPDWTRGLASGLQPIPLGVMGAIFPQALWLWLFLPTLRPQTTSTPQERSIRLAAAVSLAGFLFAALMGPGVPLNAPILWLVYGIVMAGISAQEAFAPYPKTLK